MKIIVGLGNPGPKYDRTPHNLGFQVVSILAHRHGANFRPWLREEAHVAETSIAGAPCLLVKPTTFMNLSGRAVRAIMRNRPVELDGILVVADEADLKTGTLRIRPNGSAGGHNGLRSLIECLGSDGFARLRIGCSPPGWSAARRRESLASYVLGVPPREEAERLDHMADLAADAAECWAKEGPAQAANKFNGVSPFKDETP